MKRPARILIVDDDPEIGKMLSRSLSRHGYQVDTFASAEDAFGSARSLENLRYAFKAAAARRTGGPCGGSPASHRDPHGLHELALIPKPDNSGMAVFTSHPGMLEFLKTEPG
jgi:CheY-like chemotaxis protein